LISKLAVLDRLYTFAKTDSNSSALNKSFSFPRPVGTRKNTLQSVIFNFSIKVTTSSISAIFLRLNVVLICTGRPISFAQRIASRVRAKDPLIPRNASWVYAGYKMTIFSTAEEQQREPLEIGGKVLFYPDFALRTAGGDVSVLAPWSSYVLQDRELISGQNPFSDEALLKLLLAALNEKKKLVSAA